LHSSLQGFPFVSAYGVLFVENVDDGEAGYNRSSNVSVGYFYASDVEVDPRFAFVLHSRRREVHTSLLDAIKSGLGWFSLKLQLLDQFRYALMHLQITMRTSSSAVIYRDSVEYIIENINA
jgi:hypothetical protein